MLQQFMLSDRLVVVNIPDNHGELVARKAQLEIEILALKSRLAQSGTYAQKLSVGHDLGRANEELKLVNRKIKTFNPTKGIKQKFRERQQKLKALGMEPFPELGSAEERYEWAFGALQNAVDYLQEVGATDDRWHRLIAQVAAAAFWEKSKVIEAHEAEKYYRRNHAQEP